VKKYENRQRFALRKLDRRNAVIAGEFQATGRAVGDNRKTGVAQLLNITSNRSLVDVERVSEVSGSPGVCVIIFNKAISRIACELLALKRRPSS